MSGYACTLDSLLALYPDATVGELETERQKARRLSGKQATQTKGKLP